MRNWSGGCAFTHRTVSRSSATTGESGPNKPKQTQQLKIRISMKHPNAEQSINSNAWLQSLAQCNGSSSPDRYAGTFQNSHTTSTSQKDHVFINCRSYKIQQLLGDLPLGSRRQIEFPTLVHLGSKGSRKNRPAPKGEGIVLVNQPTDLFSLLFCD